MKVQNCQIQDMELSQDTYFQLWSNFRFTISGFQLRNIFRFTTPGSQYPVSNHGLTSGSQSTDYNFPYSITSLNIIPARNKWLMKVQNCQIQDMELSQDTFYFLSGKSFYLFSFRRIGLTSGSQSTDYNFPYSITSLNIIPARNIYHLSKHLSNPNST
jgi:hypothetical protein